MSEREKQIVVVCFCLFNSAELEKESSSWEKKSIPLKMMGSFRIFYFIFFRETVRGFLQDVASLKWGVKSLMGQLTEFKDRGHPGNWNDNMVGSQGSLKLQNMEFQMVDTSEKTAQRAEKIWKQKTFWEKIIDAEDREAWLSSHLVVIIHHMEGWMHSWKKSGAKGTEAILKTILENFSKLAEKYSFLIILISSGPVLCSFKDVSNAI